VAHSPSPTGVPWLLLLRWLAGLVALIWGGLEAYNLARSWDVMADRSFIDPLMSPYRYLPGAVLKLAAGVATLARSKAAIPLVVGWIASYVFTMLSVLSPSQLPPAFFLVLGGQLSILTLLCTLWLRRQLR